MIAKAVNHFADAGSLHSRVNEMGIGVRVVVRGVASIVWTLGMRRKDSRRLVRLRWLRCCCYSDYLRRLYSLFVPQV
jgi:hypothetical protein